MLIFFFSMDSTFYKRQNNIKHKYLLSYINMQIYERQELFPCVKGQKEGNRIK